MKNKILKSVNKFNLNLNGKNILTEAATGIYASTPVIAALAGGKVFALAKESAYGSYSKIKNDISELSQKFSPNKLNINIIQSLDEISDAVDIVTNSGFLRPINKAVLQKLTKKSVITLMYEPWEFRVEDIDLESALHMGVKVYGTNEHDNRLQTMEYIGFIALYHLLNLRVTHFSGRKILVMGNEDFAGPIERVLHANSYEVSKLCKYDQYIPTEDFDIFILAENKNSQMLIGGSDAVIHKNELNSEQTVIHICGSVDFNNGAFVCIPPEPKPFGYMSYRTDFIDAQALIDLQTGSLAVAQGMLEANKKGLIGIHYKTFMESNYPALAFTAEKYW